MADPVPRLRVPATAALGEVIEVKTLIAHPMENGQRRDEAGILVPRRIINRFEARFGGRLVFAAEWGPSVAANPYLSFFLRVTQAGTLECAWTDDDGRVYRAAARIALA